MTTPDLTPEVFAELKDLLKLVQEEPDEYDPEAELTRKLRRHGPALLEGYELLSLALDRMCAAFPTNREHLLDDVRWELQERGKEPTR